VSLNLLNALLNSDFVGDAQLNPEPIFGKLPPSLSHSSR
jgi:hypothetical protein